MSTRRRADLLLSHGYCLAEDAREREVMKPYPPLGLLYLSSHLKARGFEVDLYDTTFGSLEGFRRALVESRAPVVGLAANLMTRANVVRMTAIARECGARVVVGGPEPAQYADEYLTFGADVVVEGEGERTLEELLPILADRRDQALAEVRGVVYRAGGELRRTAPREQIADLSAQPWPDRDAAPMQLYLDAWRGRHGETSISLLTARGCPYTCTWCSHEVYGRTHRRRRVDETADEVEHLVDRYRPDQLWYTDDVFTIKPSWTLEYAAELGRRGLRVPFECISRADRIDGEIAAALEEMGCRRLWIGAESGSQRVLDAMKRRADVEDIRAKTALLQRHGIEVGMFIMLGYEGEREEDLVATVRHLQESGPDVFLTTVAYPIKGTPYYDAVRDRLVEPASWETGSDRDLRVAGGRSDRYYRHATRWLRGAVELERARRSGVGSPLRRARLRLEATRGRLGMWLSSGERQAASRGGSP